MPCPDLEHLEAFRTGSLAARDADALGEHLASCAHCRTTLIELKEHDALLDSLSKVLDEPLDADEPAAPLPSIEGYEIHGELHRGGQGIIYAAQQLSTNRPVAIKLLLHGAYASRRQQFRFEREIELASSLQHPQIVTVFDRGATDDGRHYFVMELVAGRPLDRFIAERTPPLRDRAELFTTLCDTIQHAHQRGVIHRDLKPANVIVDEHARPHVLDFGLAKSAATTMEDTAGEANSMRTIAGEFMGTIAYASPEQLGRDPDRIDVRTDVYALGVMLYEALTATMPHPMDLPLPAIMERIIDHDPPRPSSINRAIDTDLEIITLKAIARDPARRYQSVGALRDDLQRWRDGKPIMARADSSLYLLRNAVRRHRVPVAAACVVFVALVAALVLVSGALDQARSDRFIADQRLVEVAAAEQRAREQAEHTEAINRFLIDMISSADPRNEGREVLVVDLIDRAAEDLDERYEAQPGLRSDLRGTIAGTYYSLGRLTDAERFFETQLAELRALPNAEERETLRATMRLARVRADLGRHEEAESMIRATIERQAELLGEDHRHTNDSRSVLVGILHTMARYDEALNLAIRVHETRRGELGPSHEGTLEAASQLALVLQETGRYADSIPLTEANIAQRRAVQRADHPDLLSDLNTLALNHMYLGRMDAAEPLLREAAEAQVRLLGDEHPATFATRQNLAWVIKSQGHHAEAAELYEQLLGIMEGVFGAAHPNTLVTLGNYASTLRDLGEYERAERSFRRAFELQRDSLGEEHPDAMVTLNNIANIMRLQGQHAEALEVYRRVEQTLARTLPADHWFLGVNVAMQGECLVELGDTTEGERLLREGHARVTAKLGPDHPHAKGIAFSIRRVEANHAAD